MLQFFVVVFSIFFPDNKRAAPQTASQHDGFFCKPSKGYLILIMSWLNDNNGWRPIFPNYACAGSHLRGGQQRPGEDRGGARRAHAHARRGRTQVLCLRKNSEEPTSWKIAWRKPAASWSASFMQTIDFSRAFWGQCFSHVYLAQTFLLRQHLWLAYMLYRCKCLGQINGNDNLLTIFHTFRKMQEGLFNHSQQAKMVLKIQMMPKSDCKKTEKLHLKIIH